MLIQDLQEYKRLHLFRELLAYIYLGAGCFSLSAQPQIGAPLPPMRRTCPGDPTGNLAVVNCKFTTGVRFQNLVTESLTDQALLESIIFGGVAEVRNDPAEWARSWTGFGYRAGSRYAQGLTKGVVEFGLGEALRTDPRNVSYASDLRATKPPTTSRRVGHAFMDFLTVRRSSINGDGNRLPNIPLFAGATASGLIGDLWYPASATTITQIALRAGGSVVTALGASFYTEFSPELGRALGAIFKRGRTPKASSPPPPPPPGARPQEAN
jgi:hypothetical protein